MKKEETLLYDVVHDYIIAENFASNTEGANKVILKLSDELMQEIYERTMTASEKRKDTMLKKKYDDSDMKKNMQAQYGNCLLYTSPSPRDRQKSRMPSSA